MCELSQLIYHLLTHTCEQICKTLFYCVMRHKFQQSVGHCVAVFRKLTIGQICFVVEEANRDLSNIKDCLLETNM